MVVKGISRVALQAKWVIAVVVGLTMALLIITSLNTQSVQAQTGLQNFGEMLSIVHNRMRDEGLLVTISLRDYIGEENESITIGYGYEDISVSIHEIGSDYFCTRAIQGGAELINCIPFSNVASITYINN